MSQSAENQSAIIENENNFNIAVESQAAEAESSHADFTPGDLPAGDFDPSTPTQDENEERMDVDEGQGDGAFSAGSEPAGETTTDAGDAALLDGETPNRAEEEVAVSPRGDEPTESQDAVDSRSPNYPTESQEQEEAAGTMDVDEPEPGKNEQTEDLDTVQNEPEFTDDAQDDSGQQVVDENAQNEELDQAEPEVYEAEADSELAVAPGYSSQVEEDQGFETDNKDAQERENQQAEVVEDMEGQQIESQTDEDPNLSMEGAEEQQGEIDIPPVADDDQNFTSGETEQTQQDENDRPEDDQNPQMCDSEEEVGERIEDDQQLAMGDTEPNLQGEGVEDDRLLAMDAGEQYEQNQSESRDDHQQLAMDEAEQGLEASDRERMEEEEQLLAMNEENGKDELYESERTESDQYLAMDETEQDQQPDDNQNFAEESDQRLAEEGDQHLAEENDQCLAEESDPDIQILDSENQAGDVAEELNAEGMEDVQGDGADVEALDYEAGMKEEVSINNKESSAAGDSNPEVEGIESGKGVADGSESSIQDASAASRDAEMDEEANEASLSNAAVTESKSSDGLDKCEDYDVAMDPEADRASDATIDEGRDIDDEPMLQVTDIKSGADAEEGLDERPDPAGSVNSDDAKVDTGVASDGVGTETAGAGDSELPDTQASENSAGQMGEVEGEKKVPPDDDDDDDDVVVLDDDEEPTSEVKGSGGREVLNSNNDMGIQIESVSGGANDVHGYHEHTDIKQESIEHKPVLRPKTEPKSNVPPAKKSSRTQTCIVCKKVGKCKYNIVRNGDIKHLCDDACFKRFRANPTQYLKGTSTGAAGSAAASDKKSAGVKMPVGGGPGAAAAQGVGKPAVPGYKTCTVCLLMNINAQGQFCIWKGLDFCGEGCLGKYQSGISSACALCTAFIPLASRSNHCLRLGDQMKPFCSNRCHADYKLRLRLCTQCQKEAAAAPDSFFSAPVGSEGSFKDFCSQTCMKKFEELLNTDIEIIRTDPSKPRSVNKCSVCQKKELIKQVIRYKGRVHHLCGEACLASFQLSNQLDLKTCDFCSSLCTARESSVHTVQFEGHQKHFCSDACVTKFRLNNRKVSPCSWCGTQRDNFDMIERLDSTSKYQLFCSLNCLSLYRVNLQAKSNQPVTCDQCNKRSPAQYHLTMSDASVRNFCAYNCVMTFQAQFSKRPTAPPPGSGPSPTPQAPTPTSTPKHKHNTRGRAGRGRQQSQAASPSFPIISNVISLAPQGAQQQVNIKNSTGMPVVVSGPNQTVKTGAGVQAPVQQQIIIQPPPPKSMKNKSLLCKPFVQTKATSCRPHTQSKECQTDEIKEKPALVPVPVPIYLPAPMALYSAPAPVPIFIPIPIPVPIFIPTTRKSANGILKQIKEIREKTPSDPLEAELLMMAAAVSADGKNSSESESDEEMLPEINNRSRKRSLPADDDDDADVMPLSSSNNKEEVGGEEDMISMALRMAEEMSGPIADLESAVEAVPVNTEPPPQPPRPISPDAIGHEEEMIRNRRGGGGGGGVGGGVGGGGGIKRGGAPRRGGGGGGGGGGGSARPQKRPRIQVPQPEPIHVRQEPPPPPPPPADANYHLKFTYGVNAWRHWVLFKNNQIERMVKPGCGGRIKLFKTDIMQCTADELNFSLCLFVKEVRKPNGDEYSPDSIYYLCLGIQQYLFESGRIDNIFTDFYYERFTECLTQILSKCQPKFNASGQMVCRIEEEHLWECKQLGAHSPYVLLNTLIYFHTKYFMLKTPEDHMKLSFAHILKYWKKGQPGKGGQPARSVSLRYYSVSTAKKDGSAPTSATKKGSKDGIPVYEVTENQDNPLRCPVKLYEFYLSKCPESIKNRSDIFYPVPERSCVPDSPVWYSTMPITLDVMTKMLTRILLVREIQEAHLHAQPIYV